MVNCRTVYGKGDTLIGRPTIEIDLDEIFDTGRNANRSWRWQPTDELEKMLAAGQIPAKDREYARYEIQARYALALTPLLFVLLGVPTGLLLRSGTQLAALAVAVGYALVYYLLQMRLSKTFGQHGAIPYWVAAWGVTVLGCATGLWLSVKAFRK
jgi:lipopolysaccharide export LptBFGC system permease protein LptF